MWSSSVVKHARTVRDAVWEWCRWRGSARIASSLAMACGVVCAGWLLVRSPSPPIESRIETVGGGSSRGDPTSSLSATSSTAPLVIVVHVAGAVQRPGVVFIVGGSRANDALRAAGGFASTADRDAVNLAMVLHDGDQLFVPLRATRRTNPVPQQRVTRQPSSGSSGSVSTSPSEGGDSTVVNINSASVAQLDSLPGVGPSTAQAIVDYRNTHGPFASIEGLLAVRGIGEAKFEALRNRVRV